MRVRPPHGARRAAHAATRCAAAADSVVPHRASPRARLSMPASFVADVSCCLAADWFLYSEAGLARQRDGGSDAGVAHSKRKVAI